MVGDVSELDQSPNAILRSGICISCIAWAGVFFSVVLALGGAAAEAETGFSLDDSTMVSLPLSWIMAGVTFLIMGIVVPAAVYIVKKFDRKLDEFKTVVDDFEGAVQSLRKDFAQQRLEVKDQIAKHREHVGDKYAQLVDLKDSDKRENERFAKVEAVIEKIRDRLGS